jgi:O-antigen ligase
MRRSIHFCCLLTFGLIPVWYRLPAVPGFLPDLYVSRFLILLPMLAAIGLWLIAGLPGFRELRRDSLRRLWALALLLLTLWGFASTEWAFQREAHPEVGQTAALQLGIVSLFALVVACAGPPRRWIIGVLIAGLMGSSLLGGGQVARQGSVGLSVLGEFTLSLDKPGVSVVQAGDVRWLRPYGLLPHPNLLGGALALGLLACGAWMVAARRALWLAGTACAAIGLWTFGLTFSRAAWGGFALGALVMLVILVRGRYLGRRLVFSAGGLILVGVLFVLLYHPFLLARAGIAEANVELRSVSDRLVYMDFAWRAIGERPVSGVGIGNFPWRASFYLLFTTFDLRGDNVHNIYLSVWAELGTIGLVLYGAALVTGLGAALRRLWRQPDAHGAALVGGVIALLAIGLLDHYPYTLLPFQTALWSLLAAAGRDEKI